MGGSEYTTLDAMAAKHPRVRNWCWTLNNPLPGDDEQILTWADVRYTVFGLEKGKGGTPHYQGYTEFNKPVRLNACKKLNNRIHWEPRVGPRERARDYCIKGEQSKAEWDREHESGPNFGIGAITHESGAWDIRPGARTDIEEVKHAIDGGATMDTIAEEHFGAWVKYRRAFEEYRLMRTEPREGPPEVIVFYGPTGVGKDYLAHTASPKAYQVHSCKWFDGYDGSQDVIFSDYGGEISLNRFLRLLDRYDARVQIKGGTVPFRPRRIFITSHTHPLEWYKGSEERYPELERRLSRICEFVPSVEHGTEVRVILDRTSVPSEVPKFASIPEGLLPPST